MKTRPSNDYARPSNLKEWARHADRSEQEVLAMLEAARPTLDVLKNIIETRRRNKRPTRGDYDNPSWAPKQAHDNGFNEALNEIEKLLP